MIPLYYSPLKPDLTDDYYDKCYNKLKPFLTNSYEKINNKTIVGYRVKDGVDNFAALRAIGFDIRPGTNTNCNISFTISLDEAGRAKNLGLLDLLFKPVFEQNTPTLHLSCGLSVEITNKSAVVMNRVFVKQQLLDLIGYKNNKTLSDQFSNATRFTPDSFRVGCNNQYIIKREEIKQIIRLL